MNDLESKCYGFFNTLVSNDNRELTGPYREHLRNTQNAGTELAIIGAFVINRTNTNNPEQTLSDVFVNAAAYYLAVSNMNVPAKYKQDINEKANVYNSMREGCLQSRNQNNRNQNSGFSNNQSNGFGNQGNGFQNQGGFQNNQGFGSSNQSKPGPTIEENAPAWVKQKRGSFMSGDKRSINDAFSQNQESTFSDITKEPSVNKSAPKKEPIKEPVVTPESDYSVDKIVDRLISLEDYIVKLDDHKLIDSVSTELYNQHTRPSVRVIKRELNDAIMKVRSPANVFDGPWENKGRLLGEIDVERLVSDIFVEYPYKENTIDPELPIVGYDLYNITPTYSSREITTRVTSGIETADTLLSYTLAVIDKANREIEATRSAGTNVDWKDGFHIEVYEKLARAECNRLLEDVFKTGLSLQNIITDYPELDVMATDPNDEYLEDFHRDIARRMINRFKTWIPVEPMRGNFDDDVEYQLALEAYDSDEVRAAKKKHSSFISERSILLIAPMKAEDLGLKPFGNATEILPGSSHGFINRMMTDINLDKTLSATLVTMNQSFVIDRSPLSKDTLLIKKL